MKKETQARRFTGWLGSRWTFRLTLLVFAAEAGWQALTSPFPMTYDEAYHFTLIQFFSHRINPVVTSQPASTYKLGAIIQDPSFLYHYIMSFPYRFITLFAHSPEIQLISLRLINVLIAMAGLLIMRKLLRLLHVSGALANLLVLTFALTPIFTVLSGQVNYDNMLIPATAACIYWAVLFIRGLDRKVFDSKNFLILLILCLFASLVKFTFLPIFVAIGGVAVWKIYWLRRKHAAAFTSSARKSFIGMSRYAWAALVVLAVAGMFLFVRIYGVNMVRYHSPAPQCNQVLNTKDCLHYYSWNLNYNVKSYTGARHVPRANVLRYDGYWFTVVLFEPFSALTPFQGYIYGFTAFLVIVSILGVISLVYTAMNFRKILRDPDLRLLTTICAVYIFCLWARNYHDYLQLGWPRAIHGRYLLPILIYIYILLASGVRHGLNSPRLPALPAKALLAFVVVASFVYFGGFRQYVQYVYPVYGRISPSDNFTLQDAESK